MAVGSTQPPTKMSAQGYLLGVKNGRYVGPTTLSPSCVDCLEILGVSTSPGALRACPGRCRDGFTFTVTFLYFQKRGLVPLY